MTSSPDKPVVTVELEACPCGEPAILQFERDGVTWCRVECSACSIRTGDFAHEKRAVAEWNNRPSPPSASDEAQKDDGGVRVEREVLERAADTLCAYASLGIEGSAQDSEDEMVIRQALRDGG